MTLPRLVLTLASISVFVSPVPAHAARGYVLRSGAYRRTTAVRPAPTVVVKPAPTPPPVVIQVDPAAAARAQKERDARTAAIDLAEKQRNERALVGVDERVVKFLKERIADGSSEAPLELAQRHESGKGVPVDPSEARRLYTLAADRGNREAKAWLQEHPAP
jgi:TPR repeat protein